MRRPIMLLVLLLMCAVTIVSAQEQDRQDPELTELISVGQMIAGEWQSLPVEQVDEKDVPLSIRAPEPSDSCSAAPALGLPDGGEKLTNELIAFDPLDPELSCMWGVPTSKKGYRTVWYKLTPSQTTLVNISTRSSTYDTVIGVYTSPDNSGCTNLVRVACNDDKDLFTSHVTLAVRAGVAYYVEVADWHLQVSDEAWMRLSAWTQALESNWKLAKEMDVPRSRHVAVVAGNDIYVIAGQTAAGNIPTLTNRTDRYNTASNQWQSRAPMLAGDGNLGYSNTTAAMVDGQIYIPTGFVGANGIYDGTHWRYSLSSNSWFGGLPVNPFWADNDGPSIYGAAAPYSYALFNGYYLIGGLTGNLPSDNGNDWKARAEVYGYDISGVWYQRTSMQTARYGHVAANQRINGKDVICVAGGIQGVTAEVLGSVACYDPVDDTWSTNFAPLNYPRYFAGSAVDGNGNWYVFGGFNSKNEPIGYVERYQPFQNQWVLLDVRFDLADPPRGWVRGGFVGNTLYVTGGETAGSQAVNLIEKLSLQSLPQIPPSGYFPVMANSEAPPEDNNTFAGAERIFLGESKSGIFDGTEDVNNIYYFETGWIRPYTARLSNIQIGSDYDLYVYTWNKGALGKSENPGANNEAVTFTPQSERTYLVVQRKVPARGNPPNPTPFRLSVN